jgi:hypothetical protein
MKTYFKILALSVLLIVLNFIVVPALISYPDNFFVAAGIFVIFIIDPLVGYYGGKILLTSKEK